MSLIRQELAEQTASLAVQGVYLGTSSWKYQGWCGVLYDRVRYEYSGKFAETRFKRNCLAEYAEVFKTVCVDVAYSLVWQRGRIRFRLFCCTGASLPSIHHRLLKQVPFPQTQEPQTETMGSLLSSPG